MLRVLTLNCWNISPPFDERMALVRQAIEELRPDVIGLQEVIVRHEGFDQAAVILDGLGYSWAFGAAWRWSDAEGGPLAPDHPDADAFGNVIASRWPLADVVVEPLPGGETGERRSIVGGRIATPDGPLPFACTHLNWKLDHGWVRERQVLAVARFARDLAGDAPGLPPIVVGDMNAEPDSTEMRFLAGLGSLAGQSVYFQDAWRRGGDGGPGHTWDNRNPHAAVSHEPSRRIDYVWVGHPRDGRGLVERARVVLDEAVDGVFPSDHFGVLAEVRT